MSKRVIDGFEPVKIKQHQSERLLKPFASGHCLNQPVAEERAVDQPSEMIILREVGEALLRALPLDRVTYRTGKQLGMALALDQVILGALLYGLKSQRLIAYAAQHHDRNRRIGGMELPYRRQTKGVRQGEI